MKLHENKKLFRQAVLASSEMMGIPEIFVEKDYWVTLVLHAIFHSPIGEQTIFKGGTALSKCFGLIDRFSEDIDLVVKHSEEETDNQLKQKIRKVTNTVGKVLPEIDIAGLTRKMGMNRKTAHQYPISFKGNFEQVRNVIVLEATWFGHYEPYTYKPVSSYIHNMMVTRNQQDIVQDYGLLPFNVNVQRPERTLCEKIMSLVRFSYSETPINDLKIKIRHIYDLHKMLKNDGLETFFNSERFNQLFLQVARDDGKTFRNNKDWLINHPRESFVFADIDNCWQRLSNTYNSSFSNLVYGKLPDTREIYQTLVKIKERVERVNWISPE